MENSCFYPSLVYFVCSGEENGSFRRLPKRGRSKRGAEKDILEKVLLSCKDVFADCWNVLACEGRQIFSAKAALIQVLLKEKKSDIIALVAGDSDKRQELYKTYGI